MFDMKIYSDHSTNQERSVLGVCIPEIGRSFLFKKEKLPSYRAECEALRRAISVSIRLQIQAVFYVDHEGLIRNYRNGLKRDGLEGFPNNIDLRYVSREDNPAHKICQER